MGNYSAENCRDGKMSGGKLSSGKMLWRNIVVVGNYSMGNCRARDCRAGNRRVRNFPLGNCRSGYFEWETVALEIVSTPIKSIALDVQIDKDKIFQSQIYIYKEVLVSSYYKFLGIYNKLMSRIFFRKA